MLLVVGSTFARLKSDQISLLYRNQNCYYNNNDCPNEITFICYRSARNTTDMSNLDPLKCRNANPISRDDIKRIKFLNCDMNQLPDGFFNGYSVLEYLDVSNMNLISFDKHETENFVPLNKFNASNKQLIELPSFPQINSLKILDLSNNPIETLSIDSFKDLTNLV